MPFANASMMGNWQFREGIKMYLQFLAPFTAGLVVLLLLVFGILQWLQVPAGDFLDWAIAGASFWWLMVIVTVPWNVYFQAKEVLAEAEQSRQKNIAIDEKQLRYVNSLAKRSLPIALGLHLLSAIGLYFLAATGISAVGYISSGAALLLTFLRPAVRGYEYIAQRLYAIKQEFKYPREDAIELRYRVEVIEEALRNLQEQLNPENPQSWVTRLQRDLEATQQQLTRVGASLEDLRTNNQAQHDQLGKEAQRAIAQLSADAQFLDSVREIIRFFKSA